MGTSDRSVNTPGSADQDFARALAEARASVGDLSVRLPDGTEVRLADQLDRVQADHDLLDYLNLCKPGGAS